MNAETIKLKTLKRCSCGKIHAEVYGKHTVSYDPHFNGVYWNCDCKSTLFVPLKDVDPEDVKYES